MVIQAVIVLNLNAILPEGLRFFEDVIPVLIY